MDHQEKADMPATAVGDGTEKSVSPAREILGEKEVPGVDVSPYSGRAVKDFPPLPDDGTKVRFHESGYAWKTSEGSINIDTKLGPPDERHGFEGYLTAGATVGAKFYERAHAQGAGTGVESPYAISLAPKVVNQEFQNRGIEEELREMQRQRRDDVEFYLRTEVSTTDDGLFLRGINYQVYAQKHGEQASMIYAASIEIEGLRHEPKVLVDAQPVNWNALEDYLKQPEKIIVAANRTN